MKNSVRKPTPKSTFTSNAGAAATSATGAGSGAVVVTSAAAAGVVTSTEAAAAGAGSAGAGSAGAAGGAGSCAPAKEVKLEKASAVDTKVSDAGRRRVVYLIDIPKRFFAPVEVWNLRRSSRVVEMRRTMPSHLFHPDFVPAAVFRAVT